MNLEKNIVFLQYITCIYVLCVIYYFYTKKFVVLFENWLIWILYVKEHTMSVRKDYSGTDKEIRNPAYK